MTEKRIDSVLGQRTSYPTTYSPDILVPVERSLNRGYLGLSPESLPFVGADAWHAYEVSCLIASGLPIVGLLKICYPATSRHIVESKSLKLYLNSFNMSVLGTNRLSASQRLVEIVQSDLSKVLCTEVSVAWYEPNGVCSENNSLWDSYIVLENAVSVNISYYTEAPDLLECCGSGGRVQLCSHLLRSNCRVTHQPDWGSVYIDIEAHNLPNPHSLLAYIVSLRGENHFHEEICELIYCRLNDFFSPTKLMVSCCYTRRGGIDICPARASSSDLLPHLLLSPTILTARELRR